MAEDKYSSNESLDRILRVLKGDTVSEAAESLPPPKRSIDESLSQIAELLNGSLEGETIHPLTAAGNYGMLYTSSNAETEAQSLTSGTANTVQQWTTVGSFKNTTPSTGTYNILVTNPGTYRYGYDISFAGTKDVVYEFMAYLSAGSLATEMLEYVSCTLTGTYFQVSGSGIETLTAGTGVTLMVIPDKEAAHFYLKSGILWLNAI